MELVIKDTDETWKFNSEDDKDDEIASFFYDLGKQGRTFKSLNLEFNKEIELSDINNLFSNGDGEKAVKVQTLILNPK